jgi:hypothetical protein
MMFRTAGSYLSLSKVDFHQVKVRMERLPLGGVVFPPLNQALQLRQMILPMRNGVQ